MPAITGYTDSIGIFIDAWADDVIEPYRNVTPLLADAKFGQKEEVGGVYHVPVRLTYEAGQSFAAARAQPGDGGTTYVGPRAGYVPDAQVEGMQVHGRSRLTYEAIARSMQSVDASARSSKKAVRAATKVTADGLMLGTLKKLEALMLHGRRGLGQFDGTNCSNVVGSQTYDGVSGYAWDVSITAASWSEAMWAAFEGHTFDIFGNSSGIPTSTKLNTATNSLLSAGVNQTGVVLIAINPSTPLTNGTATGRVLRLWHSSGTAGALATGVLGGHSTTATPDQHLMFESSGPAVEFVGLTSMARNTGTLFNINSANYGMWRGNIETLSGNLKLGELIRRLARPINHGAQGVKIRAVVPTELFAQFANDEATLRRYASAGPTAESGFDSLQLYLPHKSMLEVLGHGLQKDGEVLAYVPEEVYRVGAQDVSFISRGQTREQLLLEVSDRPGSEVRLYGQFAPVAATPKHMMHLTGFTF